MHGNSRLFFVHIPKTAGTTLTEILDQHFDPLEIFPHTHWHSVPEELPIEELTGFGLYRGHFYKTSLETLLPGKVSTLTVLRDPIERIFSAYNHTRNFKETAQHPHHAAIGGEDGTLLDYINMPDKNPTRNTQVSYLSWPAPDERSVMASQQCYAFDPTPFQDLERAKEALSQMAFVGIQEDFDRSIQLLNHTLQWDPVSLVGKANVGMYSNRASDVESSVLERLRELNQLDLELYDYGKTLFEERYRLMVQDLLWHEFCVHWRDREKPASARADLGGSFFGEGWYPREVDPNGVGFRWMGLQEWATVCLPVAATERMEVLAKVLHAPTSEILAGTRLFVNDQEVAVRRAADPITGFIDIIGRFPGGIIERSSSRPIARIRIQVPGTFRYPEERGDDRQFGLAITSVEVRPESP